MCMDTLDTHVILKGCCIQVAEMYTFYLYIVIMFYFIKQSKNAILGFCQLVFSMLFRPHS